MSDAPETTARERWRMAHGEEATPLKGKVGMVHGCRAPNGRRFSLEVIDA